MSIAPCYLIPPLPEGLEGLAELALDLRWSWSHTADPLWERIDPELWNLTRNPWLILQTVSESRLGALAADRDFRKLVDDHLKAHHEALEAPCWFRQVHSKTPLTVAYFSMEFGLSEALPIYSGGGSSQDVERSGCAACGGRPPLPAGVFSSGPRCARSPDRILSV